MPKEKTNIHHTHTPTPPTHTNYTNEPSKYIWTILRLGSWKQESISSSLAILMDKWSRSAPIQPKYWILHHQHQLQRPKTWHWHMRYLVVQKSIRAVTCFQMKSRKNLSQRPKCLYGLLTNHQNTRKMQKIHTWPHQHGQKELLTGIIHVYVHYKLGFLYCRSKNWSEVNDRGERNWIKRS